MESSLAKDRRSTVVPRHQRDLSAVRIRMISSTARPLKQQPTLVTAETLKLTAFFTKF